MENLPLTLNTHFGDPFQPDQWGKYTGKIKISESPELSGEIEVSTKWIITDEQIDELYAIYPDLWIICGITGMNEMPGDLRRQGLTIISGSVRSSKKRF